MSPSLKLSAIGLLLVIGMSCTEGALTSGGGGAPAAGGDGPTTPARQCQGLSELHQTCPCSGGLECFVLSDSYAVCGTRNGPEASTCSSANHLRADQCGCNGALCPDGQSCREIRETVSGGSFTQNRCYTVCQSTADCAAGQACLPNRFDVPTCITPECSSDADCTEDDCGHCTREQWRGGQGMLWGTAPRCVYEGKLDASSCRASGFVQPSTPYPAYPADGHICHPWILDDPQL